MDNKDKINFFAKALADVRHHDLMEPLIRTIQSNPELEKQFFSKELEREDSYEVLKFASDRLRSDKAFFIENLPKTVRILEFASDELKNDKELALAAAKQNGYSAKWFSENVRSDFDVALACAKDHGRSLYTLSGKFSDNKEIAIAAVQSDGHSLPYFDPAIQNDPEVYASALRKCHVLKDSSKELQDNRDAVLLAAQNDSEALRWCSNRLRNDKAFVLEVLRTEQHHRGTVTTNWASEEVQQICKDKDPIKALEATLLAEKMTTELRQKAQPTQSKKLKI